MRITKSGIIRVVILFFMLMGLVIFLNQNMHQGLTNRKQVLNTDWEFLLNEESQGTITLSQFKMPELTPGDIVVLSRTLEETTFPQTVLCVYSRYSAIQVYLGGELLYEDGQEEYQKGQVLGNGYHWISLPEDFGGQELHIAYMIGEVNAFTSIDPILVLDSLCVFYELMNQSVVTGLVSACAIAIGIISIFSCAATGFQDNRFQMLLWLGVFSVSVGVWMSCSSRLIEMFVQDLRLICYLEYIGMYGACASMLFYVISFVKKPNEKRLFKIMAYGFIGLSIVFIILNQWNIRHFPKTVLIFHGYALISAIIIICILGKEARNHQRAERTFLVGIVWLLVAVIGELARYRYNKMCIPAYKLNQSLVPIGVIVFILFIFTSFFYRMVERVAEEMERKTLYEMAYQDALTKLKNRAWCERVMREYETDEKPITIINMDLNYFKQVNDTLGHAIGDELLARFASILAGIFREKDCVGRMGGDEFVVILDYITDEIVEEHMTRLLQKIKEENEKYEYQYDISVSYGYASDVTGKEYTPWRVYEKADQNMYAYKEKARSKR